MDKTKFTEYIDFKKDLQEKLDKGLISTEEYERRIIEYCKENHI